MSSFVWWAVGLFVVLAIAAGGTWYFFMQHAQVAPMQDTSLAQQNSVTPEQQQRASTLEQLSTSTSQGNTQSATDQQARAQILQQVSAQQSATPKPAGNSNTNAPPSAMTQSERAALLNSLQAHSQ